VKINGDKEEVEIGRQPGEINPKGEILMNNYQISLSIIA
jgi:hypothetical protein